MTIAECANLLLTHFTPEERSVPDSITYPGRNEAVRTAMNEALQELFGMGKPWVRRDERGVLLNAPTTVDIQVTQGSTVAVIAPGDWQAWFAGCSVVIAGADMDNQIRNATASALVLKFPYSGTTGTKSAIVYHDSVTVATDVLRVQDPVNLEGIRLHPTNNSAASRPSTSTEDYGFNAETRPTPRTDRVQATAGTPRCYNVDTWSPGATSPSGIRIRLFPAPSVQCFMEYSATLAPPSVTSIASTDALPVPFNFVESIYLPIAVKNLRRCPFWRSAHGENEVNDSYQSALSILALNNPQRRSGIRFVQKY